MKKTKVVTVECKLEYREEDSVAYFDKGQAY